MNKYCSEYSNTEIANYLIQAVDSTVKSAKAVGSSKNNRVNAMAAANAGFEALRAAEQLQGVAQAVSNGSATGGAVGVSITYGQQKTEQTQHSEGNTAEKSQVNAGGKVHIQATGKGEQSHLTIKGADVSGQGGTHLKADGDVNIQAVDENHLERSKNKSSGFNVGVAIQIGGGLSAGITAGGNVAKGYGNGESQAWVASQVGSENSKTTIESGKDTNVIGSQVKGKRVEVSAENLNIESLQDTARYDGKQESVSGQVTVGYGASAGGSYSKSKVNSNYASVKTQAGIYAGDEGYDIHIKEHTELTGGLVTSTNKAETEGKNRFSTGTLNATDIENTSSSSADGFSLSGSATVSGGEAPKEVGGVKLKEIGKNHKDGSSKVELGGVAGVANQGNWGITKGLVTGLLGQVHSSSNENGITTSTINTRNLVIRDENAQTQLGTSSAEMIAKVNKDNIHQSVNQVDGSQLQSEIENDLAISKSFVNNINNTGDEIYYKIEKKEDNIFVKEKRAKDCESIDCIKMSELDVETSEVPKTKEEAEKLARMYAHGIFNIDDRDRLQGAIQYGGEDYLENDVLVVQKEYTSIAAELGFTVFERLRAGIDAPAIFGASNASREQAKIWGLLEKYNRNNPNAQVDLKHLSHSLGVSSTKNAMNWASYKGMKFDNTTFKADTVGTSYPMTNNTLGGRLSFGLYDQGYTEKASGLFRDGKVEYAIAPRDIVGTGVQLPWVPGAFSLGIGNTNTTGSNTTGIPLWGILVGDHTKAYYKDERVIDFLNPSNGEKSDRNRKEIINYQQKIWGKIGPKTKTIEFNNKPLIKNGENE
ncbi:hemagglutinin repeat-containing protein [Glaesserella parasuis]|uniref:hemagglutinin repeat-containing protein n=3 Tax=Glaesserella parasuis TaxID=738 RepID=UPI002436E70E|nr:hemagglutinin repeat-containing protein [Glaesserella parasuis]MDG6231457.1 hemagglutinin repeat-containing protein [Glaesserella parasuis]